MPIAEDGYKAKPSPCLDVPEACAETMWETTSAKGLHASSSRADGELTPAIPSLPRPQCAGLIATPRQRPASPRRAAPARCRPQDGPGTRGIPARSQILSIGARDYGPGEPNALARVNAEIPHVTP